MRLKLVLLLFIISSAQAQQKYWIQLPESIEKNALLNDLNPHYCSEWINACSFILTDSQANSLSEKGLLLFPVNIFSYQRYQKNLKTGFAIEQINGHLMRIRGLTGKGIKVGVIDGGFARVEDDPSLIHLSENNLIKAYKDYFTGSMEPGSGTDSHGTEVTQLIAGYNPEKNILHGLATDAVFYLAKTDLKGFERRIEEDHLIAAMESMHEEGVEIINISLGYTKGYNNRIENYAPEQMDGKSTAIARAVEHAATEKGMLIIVAAGNEANNIGWRILSTPGDAEHALTVGSTKIPVWDKANFSSIGPDFIDYVKPDVVVFSGVGTSYSAPIITGLAACIKQFDPDLTNLEIIEIMQKAGHLYPHPNNYLGFGVPQCDNVMKILEGKASEIPRPEVIRSKSNRVIIDLDYQVNKVILFHKNKNHKVIRRSISRPPKSRVKIKRHKHAFQTTIIYDQSAKEIIWNK